MGGLLDGIPAAIAALKKKLEETPYQERLAGAFQESWVALVSHLFDDSAFAEKTSPIVLKGRLVFEELSGAAHTHATLPTVDEKAALPGTSGAPSGTNKYVTDADARNTDARTPIAHQHAGGDITSAVANAVDSDTLDGQHAAAFAAVGHGHTTLPTSDEKAALVGTNGDPSETNKYVTHLDPRNTDARTPVAHQHTGGDVTSQVADAAHADTADTVSEPISIPITCNRQVLHGSTDASGQFIFDASPYPSRNIYVRGVLWVAGPTGGKTVTATLYNLTDGEAVTDGALASTSTTAEMKTSAALAVGAAAGNLKNAPRIYEMRLSLAGGASGDDLGLCGSFGIYLAAV